MAIWLALAVVSTAIVLPLWRPMAVAWLCYSRYESGARESARVLHKLEGGTLVLQIVDGPHAGVSCTAGTSSAIHAATEIGALREVVHLERYPGECELGSTIEASGHLLWSLSGMLAALLLALVGFGIFVDRRLG
ncbi:MAG: hypothetical protein JRG86_03660 [Deltaproteobacteria bacterium]|nr:hypothetical protein [Deltaproteobacteria bacterium]MBW2499620.1 hypothetical protein [Deltaproteobacteria bacterium]